MVSRRFVIISGLVSRCGRGRDSPSRLFKIHLRSRFKRDRRPVAASFIEISRGSNRVSLHNAKRSQCLFAFRASHGNTERQSIDLSAACIGRNLPNSLRRQMGDRCGRLFLDVPFLLFFLFSHAQVQRLLGANLLQSRRTRYAIPRRMRKKIPSRSWGTIHVSGFQIFSSRRKILSSSSDRRKRRVHRGAASRASLERFRSLRLKAGRNSDLYF
jgi:hypothetical protein